MKKATETLVSAAQQASVQVDDESAKIKVQSQIIIIASMACCNEGLTMGVLAIIWYGVYQNLGA